METEIFVPDSLRSAGRELRAGFSAPVKNLPKRTFVRAWCAIAYLFPGLHPDGYEDAESGWPRVLRPFAEEAWRRADTDEINECELYPCGAQWAGLYDQMTSHTDLETEHR